jgi:hypothetical protein
MEDQQELMKCRVCSQEKPLDQFFRISPTKNWYRRECKECVSTRHKREADESRQAMREYNREYYRSNKERVDKLNTDWKKANPEKRRKTALSYYYRLQAEAVEAYGGFVCNWCGIDEPFVLTIDHVNNDGNEHRKQIGSIGGHKFYKWLKDNGYPPGFQVLCMNCNHAKYRNGGTIPESLKGRCIDHSERK